MTTISRLSRVGMDDAKSRISAVHEAFRRCKHEEQVQLLDELAQYFKRDFLTLLPLEMVEKILSHLPLRCVSGSCIYVSKSWLQVVMSCDMYWKARCKDYGLAREDLTRERKVFSRYYDIATSSYRREYKLKNDLVARSTKLECDHNVAYIPVEPLCNGFVLQCPKEIVDPRVTLFRLRNSIYYECGHVDNIFPGGFLEILWSISTADRVLLCANNNTWVEFYFPSASVGCPPVITLWGYRGRLMRGVYNSFSMCEKCRFVVVVSTEKTKDKILELKLLKFGKNPNLIYSTVEEMPLSNAGSGYFTKVKKSCIFPDPSCQDHKLLAQFGSVVVQFRMRTLEEDQYMFSGFISTYHPHKHCESGEFTLSHDKKLIGMLSIDETLESNVWHLDSGARMHVFLEHPQCLPIVSIRYLGVGHMYLLFEIWYENMVEVCLHLHGSGRVVKMKTMNARFPGKKYDTYAGRNEQWLNCLSQPTSGRGMLFYSVFSEQQRLRVFAWNVKK